MMTTIVTIGIAGMSGAIMMTMMIDAPYGIRAGAVQLR
jgi:hypothetical protein